ncbi:response regulator [Pseudomonas sp. ML96]|uniref:ATP-binding response regulator n=1 Tax=Pseudomonas sp. ML96 TaxID=1523503 RepID=UPI0009DF47FF|nr:response regulator [Pseudomonas sp. ML96]
MSGILIVDEQPVARHALRLLMEAEGHQVLGEAGNGLEALQLARQQKAELMILDLAIPRLGGLEVIQRLASQSTAPQVLVLTGQDSEYFAIRCLEAGAAGFVSKHDDLGELKQAVHAVLHGHSHFPSHALGSVHPGEGLKQLSAREQSVLQLLAKGLSNIAIGEQLALSDKTVSTYKIRLKQKLQAGSLLELIDIARRQGLLTDAQEQEQTPPLNDEQRQELELLHRVLDTLPYTAVVRDTEGRLITCNRHHLQQHRVRLEDIRGKRIYETDEFAEENARLVHDRLLEILAAGESWSRDVVIKLHGEPRTFRYWAHPYRDANNQVLGMICSSVELTDRDAALFDLRNAVERSEASCRAKSGFLSAIGNELGGPLQNLVNMLELALRAESIHSAQEPLHVAQATARQVLAMVNELQQLNQLEAGRHLMQPKPLDLHKLVSALESSYRKRVEGAGLQLRLDTRQARHPWVWADARCLHQLLGHLLDNALKFGERGEIVLRLKAEGRGKGQVEVVLEVEDQGAGITGADRQELFEPFAASLAPPQLLRGGSGLGLALCKRLVEQMNGRIELHSSAGLGTRVSITLLLTSAQAQPSSSATS